MKLALIASLAGSAAAFTSAPVKSTSARFMSETAVEEPVATEEPVAIEEEIVVVEEPKYMTINGYVESLSPVHLSLKAFLPDFSAQLDSR